MDVKQIIAFAISREIEAAEFYKMLQDKVQSEGSKELLRELEQMERNHIQVLINFDQNLVANYQKTEISDLKISDAMIMPEESANMTFQEVIVLAMKREDLSARLYSILAAEAWDQNVRNLFRRLTEEESKHKLQLETLYDDEILKEN